MSYWAENWPVWLSAFCVLAVYSYLIKDNAVYRVMIQIFIGMNLGYQAVVQWTDILYPQWWLPMMDGFGAFAGGPGSPWKALWALVGVLGLLFYFQLSRKYFWLSRIVIGVTIGTGAGLTFKSQLGQNMAQVADSFKPLAPAAIQSKPRELFALPGAQFPPAIDGSLAFFVSGRNVDAVETLSGVRVWSSSLPANATAAPEADGGSVTIPIGSIVATVDRSSGVILGAAPATPSPDKPRPFVIANGTLEARHGGHVVWHVAAQGRIVGSSSRFVFVDDGRTLKALDTGDGHIVATIFRMEAPTATVCVASYSQPQFLDGVVIVPSKSSVTAYALRGVAENVRTGDPLWKGSFSEPIQSVQPLDGTLLVQGATRSTLWEIPAPAPKLTAGDYFDNWVFVITVISVMVYFFFSFRRQGPLERATSVTGRWLLMVAFGAFFGNTVLTRMSFLLDRLMFLVDEWLRPFFHYLFR